MKGLKFKWKLWVWVLLLFGSIQLLGQEVKMLNDAAQRELLFAKVKQIDEFIHRFNFNVNKFNPEVLGISRREEQLPLLFERNYKSQNEQKVDDFSWAAMYSPRLSFYNPDWYAVVKCEATYRGKKVQMDLTLKVQISDNGGASWIIAGAETPFLYTSAECNDPSKMIPPSNNEVGFVGLYRVFNDKNNLSAYYPKTYEADYLSILLYAVKNGEIKFIQPLSIRYYFAQVVDWIFVVEHFNREEKNSGWLISEALPINDQQKADYLHKTLNVEK